ncbi:MAG TPA: DUF1634 domain-containing protein [Terriglobales bacterium]|nr:DUF1634 domain-containing protein [Terriglobales bacterium]
MLPERSPQKSNIDHTVALILRIGAYGSVALLLLGLLLWAAFPGPIGLQVMRVGVLVLMATPVVRIVTLLVVYLHARDWKYVLISFVVLLIVLASSLLGINL